MPDPSNSPSVEEGTSSGIVHSQVYTNFGTFTNSKTNTVKKTTASEFAEVAECSKQGLSATSMSQMSHTEGIQKEKGNLRIPTLETVYALPSLSH